MPQPLSITDLDRIGRLYVVEGLTINEIVPRLNSSYFYIRNALQDLGIDVSELQSKRGEARIEFLRQRYPDYFKTEPTKVAAPAPKQQELFDSAKQAIETVEGFDHFVKSVKERLEKYLDLDYRLGEAMNSHQAAFTRFQQLVVQLQLYGSTAQYQSRLQDIVHFALEEELSLSELKMLLHKNPESPRGFRIGVREAFVCLLQAMWAKISPRKGVYD